MMKVADSFAASLPLRDSAVSFQSPHNLCVHLWVEYHKIWDSDKTRRGPKPENIGQNLAGHLRCLLATLYYVNDSDAAVNVHYLLQVLRDSRSTMSNFDVQAFEASLCPVGFLTFSNIITATSHVEKTQSFFKRVIELEWFRYLEAEAKRQYVKSTARTKDWIIKCGLPFNEPDRTSKIRKLREFERMGRKWEDICCKSRESYSMLALLANSKGHHTTKGDVK
jgi:hypothetical protein